MESHDQLDDIVISEISLPTISTEGKSESTQRLKKAAADCFRKFVGDSEG